MEDVLETEQTEHICDMLIYVILGLHIQGHGQNNEMFPVLTEKSDYNQSVPYWIIGQLDISCQENKNKHQVRDDRLKCWVLQ